MSSSDQPNHGRTHSHTRSYQRHRASSRLAPPFGLPRIPSERLVPQQNDSQEHEKLDLGKHEDPFTASNENAFHENCLSPSPDLRPSPELKSELNNTKLLPSSNAHEHESSHSYAYPVVSDITHTHIYKKGHHPPHQPMSRISKTMLRWTEDYPLLHSILKQKDTRRIFYFMLLNIAFMFIQSTYGFLTGSLGLISDSIHMFFDCIALLMGICATVMSKWSPSIKFPYGYGKIDTLAGFANGIFLMLISVEIVYEAVERLFGGSDLSRTLELLIVSALGLAVNLVGVLAFEHGHGHGHSHGHGHAGHDHSSENMQGIYLHIMADALGSLAVVVSTILVRFTGWSGFDPLASCMIAILIFASAIPLVYSSATILLLSLDSNIEYNLRDILAGVSGLRGVVGYTVPKFWLDSTEKKDAAHECHGHSHDHGHAHNQDHGHSHDHGHAHNQDHGHRHDHSHAHNQDHHHDLDHNHKHHHHESSSCNEGHGHTEGSAILGVIHVIASPHADREDVRHRATKYLQSKNMNILVQVEREGEGRCWCGGGLKSG